MATTTITKTATITSLQSLNVVRNAVRTALSSIAYLRNLFEEAAFEDKQIGDLGLKLLRPHNEESQLILSWLEKGVFDALEKKYLRLMAFGIQNADDELLECYHFKFVYDDTGTDISVSREKEGCRNTTKQRLTRNKDQAREETIALIKSLVVLTQSLSPLPDVHHLTMKLWYYDDRVPEDYEPEHFSSAAADHQLRFGEVPQDCTLGTLDAGPYGVSVKIKTIASAEGAYVDEEDNCSTCAGRCVCEKDGEVISTQHEGNENRQPNTEKDYSHIRDWLRQRELPNITRTELLRTFNLNNRSIQDVLRSLQSQNVLSEYRRKEGSYRCLEVAGDEKCGALEGGRSSAAATQLRSDSGKKRRTC